MKDSNYINGLGNEEKKYLKVQRKSYAKYWRNFAQFWGSGNQNQKFCIISKPTKLAGASSLVCTMRK